MLLTPGSLATHIALRTISEAITKAACSRMDLELNELQAEYRPALNLNGQAGMEAEIYIYDTLPGGAGFVRRIGQLGVSIFDDALKIMNECAENCDRSCYRCLRSYKNKFEHDLLDRNLGSSLLRFLLSGKFTFDERLLDKSYDLLFQDLSRQNVRGLKFARNQNVKLQKTGQVKAPILISRDGKEDLFVMLHHPLTPREPHNEDLKTLKRVLPSSSLFIEDELVIRRSLPRASSSIIKQCS